MNNRFQCIATLGFLCCSLTAIAGQKVDESLPASSSSFIRIEHKNGVADIRGWDKDSVKIEGELSDKTTGFTFKEVKDGIRINVEVNNRGNWKNWNTQDGDDLIIYVPREAKIDYESINATLTLSELSGTTNASVVNGAIDASDLLGRINLESVNGNIRLNDVSGELDVETVNGSINGAHKGTGDLSVSSVNGSIRVSSSSTDVDASAVNGGIELTLEKISNLEMSSVNGNIEVELELQPNAQVEGSTVGGAIDLIFEKPVSARFDIEAHAGGRITNQLTDDKMQKAKYGPRRWLNFSVGDGNASVELSTVNGKISLDTK